MEIYKEYGQILLPELLEVLHEAFGIQKIPYSMQKTITMVIPKQGKDPCKDPLMPESYRSISNI